MRTQQTTSPARERLVRTLAALLLAVSLCLPSLSGCAGTESVANGGNATSSQQVSAGSAAAKLSDIPEYSGALCIDVNKGQPGFSADDAARGSFLDFSELDFEGRCGAAAGLIGPETVSNAERGDISQVHPSGWVQHRYSFVDHEMLYNRSHLIAHQLCGEDANERNLITGTRTMNAVGMTYYEELVGNYVRRTNNHVLYRVTPLFAANDLVARGVQMEAESVEDGGQAIRFNVFVYNVEPGVKIDYVTGDNWESSEVPAVKTKGEARHEWRRGAFSICSEQGRGGRFGHERIIRYKQQHAGGAIRFLGRENEQRLVFFREHRRTANVCPEQEEPQIPSSRVRQRAVHVPFQQRGVHRVASDAYRRGIHALQKLQSIASRYPRSCASNLNLRPRGASTSVGLALEQPAWPFHQISEKSKIVLV